MCLLLQGWVQPFFSRVDEPLERRLGIVCTTYVIEADQDKSESTRDETQGGPPATVRCPLRVRSSHRAWNFVLVCLPSSIFQKHSCSIKFGHVQKSHSLDRTLVFHLNFGEALLKRHPAERRRNCFDFAFFWTSGAHSFCHLWVWVLSCWLGVVWGRPCFVISLFGFFSFWRFSA